MGLKFTLLLLKICMIVGVLSIDGASVKFSPSSVEIRKIPPPIYPTKPGQPPWMQPDQASSLTRTPISFGRTKHEYLVASPPAEKAFHNSSPMHHLPAKVYHPHHFRKPSSIAVVPSASSSGATAKKWVHGPASSPSMSFHKYHHQAGKSFRNSALEPSHAIHPPVYSQQGPSVSISLSPYSMPSQVSPAPLLAPSPKRHFKFLQPAISPTDSSLKKMTTPPPFSVMVLPPPPPNSDCASVTCTEPLTYTPPGAPCTCVWPIQVKLHLGIAIYTFFPLVSELAQEIAASVQLNHSQVRIMGASSQELEKSTVLINLVPWEVKFNYTTALLIYKKFWNRQVYVKASLFGPYRVVYVRYPGLPPSPPSAASSTSSIDDGPYAGQDNNGQALKPLGVAVPQWKRNGLRGSMITLIVISSFTAFVLCSGIIWFLMLKCGTCVQEPEQKPLSLTSFSAKPPGVAGPMLQRSISSSASMSISSDALTCTGSAKNFTLNDIEKVTNSFDASRVIGEGGFGIVYRGILEDGTKVAVKVLKREDQRGGREFLAEVEMLSRLHHRNLVKLIGICTEDQTRCLVYELVPNGSLESHLHGVDKETDPLDWGARMKIALGAARGLAYLHEDSSPRVIHRDFKASNILLEHDFTPKVSDFGLARTALDEGNKCISTHVMGTFGYLAPEYAMTGHLLVKSDVYSYGVVLLELLTGRKPVDLSQPPGQENLVAWARPLLTNKEGLETVIDAAIKSNLSFDSITKVAAIASMCVQPEVTHRPFMGEVVQALKLVCNEFEETKEIAALKGCSQESFSTSECSKVGEPVEASEACHQIPAYKFSHESNVALSASASLSLPAEVEEEDSGSTRRNSSGPLATGRKRQFWQRIRSLSRGSKSEQELSDKLWPESI